VTEGSEAGKFARENIYSKGDMERETTFEGINIGGKKSRVENARGKESRESGSERGLRERHLLTANRPSRGKNTP